jgi:hypothetical protein
LSLSRTFLQEAQSLGLVVSAHLPSRLFQSSFPPETRSLLLLGSSGERFFSFFSKTKRAGIDPLDSYTKEIVQRLMSQCMPDALGVYFPFEPPFLPFIQMARAGGLGELSPLGILVHQEYGPWFALRACIALSDEAPSVEPAASACEACAAPCVDACPARAVRREGFSVSSCGTARLYGPCENRCVAREACPVGVSWRYTEDAIYFHHRGASVCF